MTQRRLIVLDRDGVLNELIDDGQKHRGPWSVAELRLTEGAPQAVESATDAGYTVVSATNQPDIARKWVERERVEEINAAILAAIPGIEQLYMCAHDNADNCDCRKPKPGLLLQAAQAAGIEPADCWMVGDRWTDTAAGNAAGFKTVLIHSELSMRKTFHGDAAAQAQPTITVASLPEAITEIIAFDSLV